MVLEGMTADLAKLKVPGSSPGLGEFFVAFCFGSLDIYLPLLLNACGYIV